MVRVARPRFAWEQLAEEQWPRRNSLRMRAVALRRRPRVLCWWWDAADGRALVFLLPVVSLWQLSPLSSWSRSASPPVSQPTPTIERARQPGGHCGESAHRGVGRSQGARTLADGCSCVSAGSFVPLPSCGVRGRWSVSGASTTNRYAAPQQPMSASQQQQQASNPLVSFLQEHQRAYAGASAAQADPSQQAQQAAQQTVPAGASEASSTDVLSALEHTPHALVQTGQSARGAGEDGDGTDFGPCKTCVFVLERIKKGSNMLLPAICSELYHKYPVRRHTPTEN